MQVRGVLDVHGARGMFKFEPATGRAVPRIPRAEPSPAGHVYEDVPSPAEVRRRAAERGWYVHSSKAAADDRAIKVQLRNVQDELELLGQWNQVCWDKMAEWLGKKKRGLAQAAVPAAPAEAAGDEKAKEEQHTKQDRSDGLRPILSHAAQGALGCHLGNMASSGPRRGLLEIWGGGLAGAFRRPLGDIGGHLATGGLWEQFGRPREALQRCQTYHT